MLDKIFDLKDKRNFYYNVTYFAVILIAVFSITYGMLYFFNLTPEGMGRGGVIDEGYVADYWLGDYGVENNFENISETRPDRIIVPKVGIDTIVGKPNTRDVNVLDQYLTRGAVYYPGSGTIENGNMFVFGHSTSINIVRNQAYKTFNGLEKLQRNDEILVEVDGVRYVYRVNSVSLLNENEAIITFDNTKRLLTLTTCNTFGQKQERWVVEAEFHREI